MLFRQGKSHVDRHCSILALTLTSHSFVLKTKEQRAAEKALMDKSPLKTLTLEEFLESERHKLTGTLTPVTPESFAEWKKRRMDKKAAEEQVRHLLPAEARTMFRFLSHSNATFPRPAKPRMPRVVPCSKVATGEQRATMSPRTKTMVSSTLKSCGRRPRQYRRGKRRNDWQSNSGYPCQMDKRMVWRIRLRRPQRMASLLVLRRRTVPLKARLPPEMPKRVFTCCKRRKRRMDEAGQTLPVNPQRAPGVAPLDNYFRCTPNGHCLWHSRHENGRTHLSEGKHYTCRRFHGLRTGDSKTRIYSIK